MIEGELKGRERGRKKDYGGGSENEKTPYVANGPLNDRGSTNRSNE